MVKTAEPLAAEAPELHHPHRRGRREEHGEAHRHAGGQRRRAERLAQLGERITESFCDRTGVSFLPDRGTGEGECPSDDLWKDVA